jgi:membrane protease YdiL (CAAX protease family)
VALTALVAFVPLVMGADGHELLSYSGAPRLPMVVVALVVVGAFAEEIGWRGYLADAFSTRTAPGARH